VWLARVSLALASLARVSFALAMLALVSLASNRGARCMPERRRRRRRRGFIDCL